MKQCELLLPPLKLSDRTVMEVGAIVELSDQDAIALAMSGTVKVLGDEGVGPNSPPPQEAVVDSSFNAVDADTPPPPASAVDSLIPLNTATEDQLMELPHVGKAIAQRLLKARPYDSLEQAKTASGLKEAQWAEIEAEVTL